MRSVKHFGLRGSALLLVTLFALELWLFRDVWQNYVPANDDIALILHSTGIGREPLLSRIHHWFAEGFSNYWYVFPEWSEPHTHYLRPGVNLTFLAFHALLGTWWNGYLIACYLLYALILVQMIGFAAGTYGLRGRALALVSIGLATAPAAWFRGELFFNPSFAFDALVASLILMAFRAYLAGRHAMLALVLAAALFTKETALAAAAAAISGVLLRPLQPSRRALHVAGLQPAGDGGSAWMATPRSALLRELPGAALIALPLIAWLTLRWHAFGGQVGVAVASTGVESPVLHALRQMLEWPFNAGMITGESIAALRRLHPFEVATGFYVEVLTNAGFLMLVAFALHRRWRGRRPAPARPQPIAADPMHLADTSLWLFWLVMMLVLTAVTPRIGHAAFVLAICLLGALWQHADNRMIRLAAMALLVSVTLTSASASARFLDSSLIATNVERSRNERALFGLLRQHAAPGRHLLIVNDFSSRYVSNADLSAFAGIPGRVTRLNSIEYRDDAQPHVQPAVADAGADSGAGAVRIGRADGAIVVDVALPPDLKFKFEDVRDGHLIAFRNGDVLQTSRCRYRFPEMAVALPRPIDFGRTMALRCTFDGDVRILYFDPARRQYRAAGFD